MRLEHRKILNLDNIFAAIVAVLDFKKYSNKVVLC